ncbi:MAG TPA: rhodanese-like domain-containing protein [Aquaticitalea sp.]|nr:rhodanese-like domain-containing protein [Aquaticitalea sp.]HNU60052.1 rhodanese-like domain-containing protein [Aquaticitalea sp.]
MKPLYLFFFLSVLTLSCNSQTSDTVTDITSEELKKVLSEDAIQLIDVRTQEEYSTGHIGNAQNIDFYSKTFEADIQKLDKNQPVYLYCRSGGRSSSAAELMNTLGFKAIYNLKGGITSWNQTKD